MSADAEAKAHETAQKILNEHLLKQKMTMKHPFSSVHQIAGSLANKVDDWKQEKQQQLAKSAQETSKHLSTLSSPPAAANTTALTQAKKVEEKKVVEEKKDAPQDNQSLGI